MSCYYPGCEEKAMTKEHIPPKSFFPKDQRVQLLTVRSCPKHNNSKSGDDLYVLAHICMNVSPRGRSRELFMKCVRPQLDFNDGALRKHLSKGAVLNKDGSVSYNVDMVRLNSFFDSLVYGIVRKHLGRSLPASYLVRHIYHQLSSSDSPPVSAFKVELESFYENKLIGVIEIGNLKNENQSIYHCRVFGLQDFTSSITIIHEFYGAFKVTSMLTLLPIS